MKKTEVYVVVDTPKKAKKLKKVLDMFKEDVYYKTALGLSTGFDSDGDSQFYFPHLFIDDYNEWCGYSDKPSRKTKVSIKELRNILAREYLKEGDVCLFDDRKGFKSIGVFDKYSEESKDFLVSKVPGKDSVRYGFHDFIRYATEEEKAFLEPKKELEVGKWYLFDGHCCENKPLMLVSSNYNNRVYFCGFNFLNQWVDEDFYTTDDLNKYGYREATPQEVEQALIEEAKRRCHNYKEYDYNAEENELCGINNGRLETVFCNGDWQHPVDKFAELKEAHMNGAVIQMKDMFGGWHDVYDNSLWLTDKEYRIKPQSTFTDKDVAIVERLHDALLDNHGYSLESKLLTDARILADKIKGA